jgi:hypothetical protein
MEKDTAEKLADVLEAVRELPSETQEALVREFQHRLADVSNGQMTDAQRAEVKRRLQGPREHVSEDAVRAILRRYNPSL